MSNKTGELVVKTEAKHAVAEKISADARHTSNSSSGDSVDDIDGDYGSYGFHVFADPAVAAHWAAVYDKASYEGRHRFDPAFTWSATEEKAVRKRVDYRIMLWCWWMFVALELNRRNINRAISDNMLPELGMTTNDFNYGQTIFLLSFLAAELPSGLISKKLGPDIWIPSIICMWSIISAAQAGITSKTSYYVIRCLLGLLMGGFIPDTVLYITYWYKKKELSIRLSWFWTVLSVCNIVGSLLAAGILQMRGIGGWSGWQWLFLIEGLFTLIIGILSWHFMPASPAQSAGRFRGGRHSPGWFNEREEKILVNRLLRDDPSKGDMHNRQAVTLPLLWKALKDYDLWPLYLLGLTTFIPATTTQNYLALILRTMGFSTFNANLLTIPSQFLYGTNLLIITWFSERVNERAMVASIANWWFLPFLIALVALGTSASNWVRYALLSGLLSYPYQHAIQVAWNSRNSNSVRTRAVSAALYNMFVQSGNIIASNVYREEDRPFYISGNKVLLGLTCYNLVLYGLVKFYYVKRNAHRERIWNKMTAEGKNDYIHNTKDEGAKRLDFRFAH
ncbi:hypothetical protein LTR05_008249 [Lithohypha guttulata]|uniref:Major facilitator superfamily (MFS) profile domain-containing protein n=1 Tax=Lithohypha guttulata TaxID=1690604 RepID=A0AAN7STQ9_9EURO|nr:hypothetical protein LTR05_008249 [Lithohypha guttulata]